VTDKENDVGAFLCVGDVVLLQLDPAKKWEARYKTFVRGWHRPHHVLVDRPRTKGQFVQLFKGSPCVVRLLSQGKAVGFASRVLDWDSQRDQAYCRIAWPQDGDVVSFRRYERVDLAVPCTVTVGDATHQGEVRDVSVGGCGVFAPAPVSDDASVELSFTLPDGLPVEGVQAEVRSVRRCPDGSFLGCQFSPGQEHIQSDMAFFVAALLPRSEPGQGRAPRVLVVEENEENATALRAKFEEQGWDVFVAGGSFEGMLRLRMLTPNALIVNEEQKDLGCLEMLQLLKSTRGLESLPVYIYGGGEKKEKAQEAGCAGYFGMPMDPGRVFKAVSAEATEKGKTS